MRTYGPSWQERKEDVTKCVESVHQPGRAISINQCRFNRGYGKDGLYCKSHAKRYPTSLEPIEVVYVVDWGGRGVDRLEVISKTAKQMVVKSRYGGGTDTHKINGKERATEVEAWRDIEAAQLTGIAKAYEGLEKTLAKIKELEDSPQPQAMSRDNVR